MTLTMKMKFAIHYSMREDVFSLHSKYFHHHNFVHGPSYHIDYDLIDHDHSLIAHVCCEENLLGMLHGMFDEK